jgi:hypothetical protein
MEEIQKKLSILASVISKNNPRFKNLKILYDPYTLKSYEKDRFIFYWQPQEENKGEFYCEIGLKEIRVLRLIKFAFNHHLIKFITIFLDEVLWIQIIKDKKADLAQR